MRPCDTCGESTDLFAWPDQERMRRHGRSLHGRRIPRCQPCRIATKACATLHRTPPPGDEAEVERRLLALRREKAEALGTWMRGPSTEWLRLQNQAIRRAERDLRWLRAWTLTQMAETVADDPRFIRKLLEVVD